MSVSIQIVGQMAMDQDIRNFRSETDFFTLEDYIFHCGASLGEFYRQEFLNKYAELRQEKKDELVSLDPEILNEAVLKVEKKDGRWFATLPEDVFSFPFERSSSGYQHIEATKPAGACSLERMNIAEKWQFEHYPYTETIFWYPRGRREINFITKGYGNLAEVSVLYAPAISDTMLVPDALVKMVITDAVSTMKGLGQGTVVKTVSDLNSNKIIQTEINKAAL